MNILFTFAVGIFSVFIVTSILYFFGLFFEHLRSDFSFGVFVLPALGSLFVVLRYGTIGNVGTMGLVMGSTSVCVYLISSFFIDTRVKITTFYKMVFPMLVGILFTGQILMLSYLI